MPSICAKIFVQQRKINNALVKNKAYENLQVELGMIKQEDTLTKCEFSDEIKRNILLWSAL